MEIDGGKKSQIRLKDNLTPVEKRRLYAALRLLIDYLQSDDSIKYQEEKAEEHIISDKVQSNIMTSENLKRTKIRGTKRVVS